MSRASGGGMSGPSKYVVRVEETITTRTTRILEIDISAQSAEHARRLAEKTYPYFLPLYVPRVLKDQEDEIKDLRFDAFSADDEYNEPGIIDVQPVRAPNPPSPRLLAAPPKAQAAPSALVFERIDRIAKNGDIREHLIDPASSNGTRARRALCGLRLDMTQPVCGNAICKRCERAARSAAEA